MARVAIEFVSAILIFLLPSYDLFASEEFETFDSTGTFVVNKIILEGNRFTKSYVILRELPFKEGDSATIGDLDYARERIYSTGLFTKVLIEALNRVSIQEHSTEGTLIELTRLKFRDDFQARFDQMVHFLQRIGLDE